MTGLNTVEKTRLVRNYTTYCTFAKKSHKKQFLNLYTIITLLFNYILNFHIVNRIEVLSM